MLFFITKKASLSLYIPSYCEVEKLENTYTYHKLENTYTYHLYIHFEVEENTLYPYALLLWWKVGKYLYIASILRSYILEARDGKWVSKRNSKL